MMPSETSPKYGTGEFPPPRGFDGAGKNPLSDAVFFRSKANRLEHDSDPQMAPLKTVGLLCAVALGVMALGIVMALAGCAGNLKASAHSDMQAHASTSEQNGMTTAHDNGHPSCKSTPRAEWKLGETPRLYQTDPEWAYAYFADGTMLTHGCGPTALSMAYVGLTGDTRFDPRAMAKFATENGYVDCGETSLLLMSEGARKLGLKSRDIPASEEALRKELQQGSQLICSVHKGDFTNRGHFILLAAMNPDGTVEIRDPNSEDRTSKAWDLGRIVSQCDNIWSLSR